jgi:hypothetical protein
MSVRTRNVADLLASTRAIDRAYAYWLRLYGPPLERAAAIALLGRPGVDLAGDLLARAAAQRVALRRNVE